MTQPASPTDAPPATKAPRKHYQWMVFDSARWDGFAFRPDDIVISTPAKCGTHWVTMICALLVFGTPTLPRPIPELSPMLDLCLAPIDEIRARLQAQDHRRFIKSHIPLDGLPTAFGVTFVVVGRDPRDVAISMDHFIANLKPEHRARAGYEPDADDQRTRVLRWLFDDGDPTQDNLRWMVAHLTGAWHRREDPDVVLLHYADLSRDLDGQMRQLAARLGIEVRPEVWPELVEAAGFQRMKANAEVVLLDDIFDAKERFFHSGTSGQWRDVLTEADLARYGERIAELAPSDLVHWLHHGFTG